MMSKQSLTLKWGSLKGWNGLGDNEPAMAALRKYHDEPVSMSAAAQRDTDTQKEALCDLIDAVDGEIWNDWDGKIMTKDEAKAYVRDYAA
jgi:hypothetical protein